LNPFALSKEENDSFKHLGMQAIINNQLAMVLLAGGQSKRLSISYPKGAYSIGLLFQKSLFQLQAERLIKVKQLALKRFNLTESDQCPRSITHNECTHNETVDFFEENY